MVAKKTSIKSNEVPISLLIGLGRRTTTDANDPIIYDYKREHFYNYYSFAIEILVSYDLNSSTKISLGIENLISGNAKTYLSDEVLVTKNGAYGNQK
ncbi:MAG: hypothetical protein WA160_03455 [Pseudobdellovibrio sp.]